jgi:hypothetical protein
MRKLYEDSPTDDTPIADPRKVTTTLVGTPLRDAAVDPKDGDFLAPTNAGEANPHGPDVVNPEIHASQGLRPVRPGDVPEADEQDGNEKDHTVELQASEKPEQPAGNASKSDWVEYAVRAGYEEGSLEEFTRDEIRDLFK